MIDSIKEILSRSAGLLRAMIGAPDYARYLAHMRCAHPTERVMSETEFHHARLMDRYDRPGSRCC